MDIFCYCHFHNASRGCFCSKKKFKFQARVQKCHFGKIEKSSSIREYPRPQDMHALKRFLGMVGTVSFFLLKNQPFSLLRNFDYLLSFLKYVCYQILASEISCPVSQKRSNYIISTYLSINFFVTCFSLIFEIWNKCFYQLYNLTNVHSSTYIRLGNQATFGPLHRVMFHSRRQNAEITQNINWQ